MTIGDRLREERDRLGLNQTEFAKIAGTTKKSQIDYEKNLTQPKAGYLALIGEVGVDVLYVVTGQRTPGHTPLSRRESALLDNYRHSPQEGQAAIEQVALIAAKPQPGKVKDDTVKKVS